MEDLRKHIGTERALEDSARGLRYHLHGLNQAVVGALHVTCADEAELEAAHAFERWFVHHMLPARRMSDRAPMRIANLGGRYEWAAAGLAEDHYATPESKEHFKVMVVKIDAHVGVDLKKGEVTYGRMDRYGVPSSACGALGMLMDHPDAPPLVEMRDAFRCEGRDRIAEVHEIAPRIRPLLAAVVHARLQARRAMIDIQGHTDASPTLWFIVPAVTLNRPDRDTEIVCGLYTYDRREAGSEPTWTGLGDDARAIEVVENAGRVQLSDPTMLEERPARCHRSLVEQRAGEDALPLHDDLLKVRDAVQRGEHKKPNVGHAVLRTALHGLLAAAPVPGALILFADGLIGIHHVHRAHRLAREQRTQDAEVMLHDLARQLHRLPQEDAARALERLARAVHE